MADFTSFGDVGVELVGDFVASVEIRRPPHNFFDLELIDNIAAAFEALDAESECRAIVLCSQGKNFCAGAQLGGGAKSATAAVSTLQGSAASPRHLYDAAVRLFSTRTPVVAAVQGAAVGGGLGLALMPDFRVAAAEARFAANFARLGFHHGFGLSVTLPQVVGRQRAMDLLYTGRRVSGEEALAIGLCDKLVGLEEVRETAIAFAKEIAQSAPLAVLSIRETLRGDLVQQIRQATERERREQERLQRSKDFREGVQAMGERRLPNFIGS